MQVKQERCGTSKKSPLFSWKRHYAKIAKFARFCCEPCWAGWLATILQVLAQSVFIVVACDRPLCPPAWVSKPWRGFGITLFYGITKQQNFPDLFSPFESGFFFFSLCCFSQKPITMMMGMDCIFHKTQPCTDACKGDGCYRKSHLGLPLDKE